MIPEDKIREVKNSADIVEVVSEAVSLKRAGKNYLGLCPFHSEKTPSFTVSPDKQIFHCFGCSEGGSVINFVMRHEGLSFPEAVRKLAGRYGVEIPLRSMSPEQKRRFSERESLLDVNRKAAEFYRKSLQEHPGGQHAMRYLTHRGFDDETIKRFSLGYAPKRWDALTLFFRRYRIPASTVEKAGLILPGKSGRGHYDRFRDRIIFPIFNPSQSVIGFGGRVLDDSLPKYLNSPETPLFNKRRSLYGIDRARQACRQTGTVYVVEGYFDLLALHQHLFANSVATLGTALTSEHVQTLKGLTGEAGKIVLVFDSDTAGIKAAKRSIEVFDRGHVDAHILVLPAGQDPDSYLREAGRKAFEESAGRALGVIPFLLETAVSEYGLSVQGKMRILSRLTEPLAAIGDKVARALHVKEVAERLDIDERSVLEKVRHKKQDRRSGTDRVKGKKENRHERLIVSMMFQFSELVENIENLGVLDHFQDETLKAIGSEIMKHRDRKSVQPSDIVDRLAKEEWQHIAAGLAMGDSSWDIKGCDRYIRRFVETRKNRTDFQRIDQLIKKAEKSDDQEGLIRLLNQRQQMAIMSEKRKMSMLDAK